MEYDTAQKTTLERLDVKSCLQFWEDEGNNLHTTQKLGKKFPFFKGKKLYKLTYGSFLLLADSEKVCLQTLSNFNDFVCSHYIGVINRVWMYMC